VAKDQRVRPSVPDENVILVGAFQNLVVASDLARATSPKLSLLASLPADLGNYTVEPCTGLSEAGNI
jgi:hypothetical protein